MLTAQSCSGVLEYKRDKARDLTCTVKQDYGPISSTIIYELLLLTHSLWTTFPAGYLSLHQWKDDESNCGAVNLNVARYRNHSKK
jgi:hypothetical protein